MTRSRAKGKRGELELVRVFADEGYSARRSQQYRGTEDSADLVFERLDALHVECKRTERLRLYDAVDQATRDSGDERIAVVAHRKSRHDWVFILPREDFFRLLRTADLDDLEPAP